MLHMLQCGLTFLLTIMGNGPGWAFQVEPLIFKSRLLLNMSSLYSVTIMPLYKVVGKSLSKFPELGSAQAAFNHCGALPPLLGACLDLY